MANKQTEHEREHRGFNRVPILGGLINRIQKSQEERQRERERKAYGELMGEFGAYEWGNNLYEHGR